MWPLLDRFDDLDPGEPLGNLHVWVDMKPCSMQGKNDFIDDDNNNNTNGKKKKGKSKMGEASPATKKVHPRSHESAVDDGNDDDDEPLMCSDYFFTGSCEGLNAGKKKNCRKCELMHYATKKELTLYRALKSGPKNVLKIASKAALDTQRKIDGEDANSEENAGIDMLYYIQIPLDYSKEKNVTQTVTEFLAKESIPMASIAYVVYEKNQNFLYDRFNGGKILSPEEEENIFGTNNIEETPTSITKSDSFIEFPAAVLENILLFLPDEYSGVMPMVCKNLHSEIGTQSPSLWKNLISRHEWNQPKQDFSVDPTQFYKDRFISNFRVFQRVQSFQHGLEKAIHSDRNTDLELSNGTATSPPVEDISLGDSIIRTWDDKSIVMFHRYTCTICIQEVSFNSDGEKYLREVLKLRLAPIPHSKKTSCMLAHFATDDRYLLSSFRVDGKSLLTTITKDELLANSSEDVIDCGDVLQMHDLSCCFVDYFNSSEEEGSMDAIRAYIDAGENIDDLKFIVENIIETGHGMFVLLVRVEIGLEDDDDASTDVYVCDGLMCFSASKGRQGCVDFHELPNTVQTASATLDSNYSFKKRTESTTIICKQLQSPHSFTINVDRNGRFSDESSLLHNFDNDTVPGTGTNRAGSFLVPIDATHTFPMMDGLVTMNDGMIYYICNEGSPVEIPLKEGVQSLLNLSRIDENHILIACREGIVLPNGEEELNPEEDIDAHWFGEDEEISSVHLRVVHVPDQTVIYDGVIGDTSKIGLQIWNRSNGTIVASINSTCKTVISSAYVNKLRPNDAESSNDKTPKQKKQKKKKRLAAKTGKKDGFARGMSLRG